MRFGLRTLLVATLILAVPMAWLSLLVRDAQIQSETTARMGRSGFHFAYNSAVSYSTDSRFDQSARQSKATKLIDDCLGMRLFGRAIAVHVDNDSNLTSIQNISQLENIQLVDLSYTDVTDQHISHLRSLPRLRTIYLSGTDIGDAGVQEIKHLKELRRLSLAGTQITDLGVESLAEAINLQHLCLSGTRVTDECVADLLKLTNLNRIELHDTQVSKLGLQILRTGLPSTQVE